MMYTVELLFGFIELSNERLCALKSFRLRHPPNDVPAQHTTQNIQHTTRNTEHTTHNTLHNTQHITHNTHFTIHKYFQRTEYLRIKCIQLLHST